MDVRIAEFELSQAEEELIQEHLRVFPSVTAGFGLVSALARNPGLGVPILAHLDFGGALCAGPKNGVSSA